MTISHGSYNNFQKNENFQNTRDPHQIQSRSQPTFQTIIKKFFWILKWLKLSFQTYLDLYLKLNILIEKYPLGTINQIQ